jgi:hypothetical protein
MNSIFERRIRPHFVHISTRRAASNIHLILRCGCTLYLSLLLPCIAMNNFASECNLALFYLYLSLPKIVLSFGIHHTIHRNYNRHNNYNLCTLHRDCSHSILSKPVWQVLMGAFRSPTRVS